MHPFKLALLDVLFFAAMVGVLSVTGTAQDAPRDSRRTAWSRQDIAEFRAVIMDLRAARAAVADAEDRLLDLILSHSGAPLPPVRPPVVPPVDLPPDETPVEPDPVDPPEEEPETPEPEPEPEPDPPAPDAHTGNSFPGLPFDVPDVPAYAVPTLADCDWTIEDGVATSRRELAPIVGTDLVALAYKSSVAAGHELPITVGVWDKGGVAIAGGQWDPGNSRSISIPDGAGGFLGVSLEVLGLDNSCEVTVGWSRRWGYPDYVGLFNIGIRGQTNMFVIHANAGVARLIVDGCWWLANEEITSTGAFHASGMHIDNWGTLVWSNHKWRGVTPADAGIDLSDHSGYLKSCIGKAVEAWATIEIPWYEVGTWIIGCNLKGGNRTGFQIRPGSSDGNARPVGPIVIANNYADGYGWNMGSGPETFDGGACITTWVGPESWVYVLGNVITDAKYAAFTASAQTPSRNWLNDDGFPIRGLHLYGNTFENKRATRSCVGVSAVQEVHWWDGNEIEGAPAGDVAFNSTWNMAVHGIRLGSVEVHGEDVLERLKALDVRTWDPSNANAARELEHEVMDGWLVPK